MSYVLNVSIWAEDFTRAGILLLQWQGENLAHRQNLKFPTFNLYIVLAKIPYIQRYLTDFQNFAYLKCVESGHLGRKFQVRRYFSFAMASWKLRPSTRFEISHFQPVNCTSKNPISPKVFNRFSKTFIHLKRYESGHLGRKFQVRRYFTFAMASWKLSPSTRFEIFHFQHANCPSKNPISQRYLTDFQKLCFIWNVLKVDMWAEYFEWAGILHLQWQGENLAHRQNLKFPTFNL